jgi:hypothetical protein
MLLLLLALAFALPVHGAATFPSAPSGEAWAVRYAPKSSDYFWDYGARLAIDIVQWDRTGLFGSLLFRSTAGYDDTQDVTYFDPIYLFYHQAIGVSYRRWGIFGFASIHRDCLHDIDRQSTLSEFWTTVRFGMGNFNPYMETAWRGIEYTGTRYPGIDLVNQIFGGDQTFRTKVLYCAWAGPTIGSEAALILDENNSYLGEAAVMAGLVMEYLGWIGNVKGFSRVQWSEEPDSPHHEIDLKLEVGRKSTFGDFRLVFGHRFRDTRPIRPADQKSYWGFRYLF